MIRLSLLVLFLLLVSCTTPDKETAAVKQVVEGIIAADNDADLSRVLSFYDDTAVLAPPGKPDIKGLQAIEENYRNIFAGSALHLNIQIESITIANDLAVCKGKTLGRVISKTDSVVTEVNDKFVMALRKTDRWKITLLIWSH